MAINSADVAALLAMPSTETDGDTLQPLTTVASVLAHLATVTRSDGGSEADMVELVVRAAGLMPRDVRASERILRRLGYRVVADRLASISGRRKNSLAPLP